MTSDFIKSFLQKSWKITFTYYGLPVALFSIFARNFPYQIGFTLIDTLIFLVLYWLFFWIGNILSKMKRYSASNLIYQIPCWRMLLVSMGFIILPLFSFWGQCMVFLLWGVFVSVYPIVKLFHIHRSTDKFADQSSNVNDCHRELFLGLVILTIVLFSFISY